MDTNNEQSSEEIEKRKINYHAMVEFFKQDSEIKNILMNLAPKATDEYNEESRLAYLDKASKTLDEIESRFKAICENFGPQTYKNGGYNSNFSRIKDNFFVLAYSNQQNSLQKVYQTVFTQMKPKLIEESKQKFVGSTFLGGFFGILGLETNIESINELLHVTHSAIVNDHDILRSLPIVATKKNSHNRDITLYGEPNDVSLEIYKNMPIDLDTGFSDIVSMKDRTLMMIKDLGHALTIDIDSSNKDNIAIRYFVPKLCNSDMIKELPGINTSSISDNGANGFFVTNRENLSGNLFSFINKVPTDADFQRTNNKPKENDDQER